MVSTVRKIAAIVMLLGLFLLTGCFAISQQGAGNKSSLVTFLYPDRSGHIEIQEIPHLRLPLRIGVAFTPATQRGRVGFTEVEKRELADKVSLNFQELDFVSSIEIIPSDYLRPRGGFTNLDQLKQIFNIDVMVLLSYDQSMFTNEGLASLAYWTIVGAYIVPGEKNDTHTLIDAAVFDIESRKMLFRVPGSSMIKSRATLVANSEQQFKDSTEGFKQAGALLAGNLDIQLDLFTQRITESPEEVTVSRRPGYVGSGSADWLILMLVTCFFGNALRSSINSKENRNKRNA